MRFILIIMLMLLSIPAYAKEKSEIRSKSGPKPLICTHKNQPGCLTTVAKVEVLVPERVIDGDTLVASGRKIRLWGINAPEKGERYYDVATMFLEAVLKNGDLKCKFLNKDRYQRDVMHCWVNQADLGALIVEAGLAVDYEKYSGGFYYYEERLAKLKRRGQWKNKDYKIGH